MIVRILTEGQFEVPEEAVDELNRIDGKLEQAVEAGDEDGFRGTLADLIQAIKAAGTPLGDEELRTSDAVVPPSDATLGEVNDLLGEEGLLPG